MKIIFILSLLALLLVLTKSSAGADTPQMRCGISGQSFPDNSALLCTVLSNNLEVSAVSLNDGNCAQPEEAFDADPMMKILASAPNGEQIKPALTHFQKTYNTGDTFFLFFGANCHLVKFSFTVNNGSTLDFDISQNQSHSTIMLDTEKNELPVTNETKPVMQCNLANMLRGIEREALLCTVWRNDMNVTAVLFNDGRCPQPEQAFDSDPLTSNWAHEKGGDAIRKELTDFKKTYATGQSFKVFFGQCNLSRYSFTVNGQSLNFNPPVGWRD